MSGLDLWGEESHGRVIPSPSCALAITVAFIADEGDIQQWRAEFPPADLQVVPPEQAGLNLLVVDERLNHFPEALYQVLSFHHQAPPTVVFLLSEGKEPDCVRAFAHGAFDYIHLPILGGALAARLKRIWARQTEHKQLTQQLTDSSAVAFQSMSMNAELGRILNFLENCFSCNSFAEVAKAAFEVMKEFGISTSLAVFHDRGVDFFSDDGELHVIEKEVLETSRSLSRIYDFGARTTINFAHVSILVRNMPIQDQMRYGILKDHLCFIANGLEARIFALIVNKRASERANRIQTTAIILQQMVAEMESAKLALTDQSSEALSNMLLTLTSEFSQLSLTGDEEQRLVNMLTSAGDEVHKLFKEATERDVAFRTILSQLTETLRR